MWNILCSIFILANEIVDQTNGKKINNYYDDYKDDFDKDDILKNKILKAMDIIEDIIDKTTIGFVSKKLKCIHCFALYSICLIRKRHLKSF